MFKNDAHFQQYNVIYELQAYMNVYLNIMNIKLA